LAWEPNPVKHQMGRYLAKEGADLPNSLTEDIRAFSYAQHIPTSN